jgi:hypothetical protein
LQFNETYEDFYQILKLKKLDPFSKAFCNMMTGWGVPKAVLRKLTNH